MWALRTSEQASRAQWFLSTLSTLSTLCALWTAGCVRAQLLPRDTERLHASVGGFAVMNCHLDFPFDNEIPYHLQWDKSGETIFSWYSAGAGDGGGEGRAGDRWGGRVRRLGDGRFGLGRGSINLTSVRETDAGLYRCRVSFPNRSPPTRNNGTSYYLDVDGGNLIVTPPVNVTVVEGERAELECTPKSLDWTVEWTRDNEALAMQPTLAARALRLRNGSLVLPAAARTDAGEYACRVLADDSQHQSASAFLDVHYKAKVVYAPTEKNFPLGKPASLDCHFSANPPLTNLRWEKDGFLFDPYNVPGVFYSRNGSLLFNRVDESHEGEYSCTPYNALGSEGPSPAVRVRVQRPPVLAARPQPLYVARLGAAVVLPCVVAPDPHRDPPRIIWTRKDGTDLPKGRHSLDEGNLTLTDITEDDRGVYVCTASNDAAAVSADSELLIENVPPRAPYNLTASPSLRSIHLSWVPGHNGIDVDYNVWYRERSTSEWRTMKILSLGVTEATLVGLRPSTQYELRVLSQDRLGDGLFSKPLFVRTFDEETEGETSATAEPAQTDHVPSAESALGGGAPAGGPLRVSVRLVDEGALVRWRGGAGGRCSLTWFGPDDSELFTADTLHDYILVSTVEEGVRYRAHVECGAGGAGVAVLAVPAYGRLRGAALGAAGAALLVAGAALAGWLLRRRARARRAPPAPQRTRIDKRRY